MYHPLFCLVIIANYCFGMDVLPTEQHIIFLNGTTTAGKSSIASKLKEQLEAQSLRVEVLAIDDFMGPKVLWELLKNRLNPFNVFVPNANLITESAAKEMVMEAQKELCEAARTAYKEGKIVIIDSPAYNLDRIDFYKKSLNQFAATWVLVYCPLATLVERVINRNETLGIADQRSVLQALDQFEQLYVASSDSWVDQLSRETLLTTCNKAAAQHGIMQEKIPSVLKGIQDVICPDSCEKIQNTMVKKFMPDGDEIRSIAPIVGHDCVVNTKWDDPDKCAQSILEVLTKKTG